MAAGLGFKDFVTGEVLTAADVDGYLMQGIWVFDDAAARDAAVTSPQEGNACYLKDTNEVLTYSGSVWVAVGGGSPLTTKGDLYTFSTVDARLAVGANDTVLTADSSEATGLKWAAASGGGANWSLLNTGGTALTGAATITVSGISGQDKIMVLVQSASAGASSEIDFRFNTDSGSNYSGFGMFFRGDSSYDANQIRSYQNASTSVANFARQGNSGSDIVSGGITITGCNASGVKAFQVAGAGSAPGGFQNHTYIGQGIYTGSSTISSVSILSSSGNFDAGTIYVYTSA
jgi:hypothetical protein